MTLKVALQMDPLSSLNEAADTTVALIFKASTEGMNFIFMGCTT
ncbi:MAG: hypothetical protein J0H12_01510 [Candidatus Paracaedimonas acanthamoebae]|uniref:Prokaryotic glutathione synthetase N-terminal domain-containing protein n=1 Tax=Candidatus Paracaedimonas acanthamoebae TaxID=244581 RepID=A0A8J7PGS8_9PROT|nr:hypothetical protein [Candidatus Paracaedimonas acanthamoebae]